MKYLNVISDGINQKVKKLCSILLMVMTAIIVIQVFYRYIIGTSLSWSEEIARYIFIWIIMLGASIGVKESFHVAVTIIVQKLSEKARCTVDTILNLLLGIVGLIMTFYGYSLARTVAIQLSPAVRISMFWVYLSVPVSGVLIIIHALGKMQILLDKLKINP